MNLSTIFHSMYSGIPVYEQTVNGVAVMRRLKDSYLNATQILKVANVPKPRRLRIIEAELLSGVHEKVQGGYGKYQGTWVPYKVGVDLAIRYNVYDQLKPIIEYNPTANGTKPDDTPSKVDFMRMMRKESDRSLNNASSHRVTMSKQVPVVPSHHSTHENKRGRASPPRPPIPASSPVLKRHRVNHTEEMSLVHGGAGNRGSQRAFRGVAQSSPTPSPLYSCPGGGFGIPECSSPVFEVPNSNQTYVPPLALEDLTHSTQHSAGLIKPDTRDSPTMYFPVALPVDNDLDALHPSALPSDIDLPLPEVEALSTADRHRGVLMALFLDDDRTGVPPAGLAAEETDGLNFDLVIDDQGHTPLHWAAALGRNQLVEWLLERGADSCKRNQAGQTPLIRAVLSTDQHERSSFPGLLVLLHDAIPLVDSRSRSVVHHTVLAAGEKSKASAAMYYLDCLIQWVARSATTTATTTDGETDALPTTSTDDTVTNDFISFLNLTDCNGDTALNIAARIGNSQLVQILVNSGASVEISNSMGLKPRDFSVVNQALQRSPNGLNDGAHKNLDVLELMPSETVVGSNTPTAESRVSRTGRGSQLVSLVQHMVDELEGNFQCIAQQKDQALQSAQRQLQQATKELSQVRSEVEALQKHAKEREALHIQIGRLESLLALPQSSPDEISKLQTALLGPQGPNSSSSVITPDETVVDQLQQLQTQTQACELLNTLLQRHIDQMQTRTTHKEWQCKRVISLCCNIPMEKVDEWANHILTAMESEHPDSGAPDMTFSTAPGMAPAAGEPGNSDPTAGVSMGQGNPGMIDVNHILSASMSEEQNIQRITEFMNSIRPSKKTPLKPSDGAALPAL
ncbi:transcriptional regulator swi6 [Dispira parvispora]|uniref:Transcriptional regulator swi6 n=1 Tax=Dispira parvispora TaxID=1520584 RepID=A0A9W8E668_9FUNG|nr:transcriptional regulator swi6 [Dispira parvispora]